MTQELSDEGLEALLEETSMKLGYHPMHHPQSIVVLREALKQVRREAREADARVAEDWIDCVDHAEHSVCLSDCHKFMAKTIRALEGTK